MKRYVGVRVEHDALRIVVIDEAGERELNPRFDLRRHSPTGFEISYNGSGPAQTALALCADTLGNDEVAVTLYQRVKATLVANLPREGFDISELVVRDHINNAKLKSEE